MTRKKRNTVFFFSILLLIQLTSYSQTGKEPAAIFVLQGAVKLKNKSIDGVSLELTKNGKQISKIITTKNGLYSFQLDKSSTDQQNEYLLSIVKEGIITGIVSINTYAPQSQSDYTPYIFTLEISLTPPVVAGVSVKRDFGKIKWYQEQNQFNFDPEYAKMVEKNKELEAATSTKYISDLIEKVKKQEIETEKKSDSLANQQLANKEDSTKLISLVKNSETATNKTSNIAQKDQPNKAEAVNSNSAKKNQTDENKKTNELAKVNNTNHPIIPTNSNEKKGTEKNTKEKANSFVKENVQKQTETQNSKDNITKINQQKQTETSNSKALQTLNKGTASQKTSSTITENEKATTATTQIGKEANSQTLTKHSVENDRTNTPDTEPRIQLKLKGNPMGQFKKNLSIANVDQNSFNGTNVFVNNNEESKLLNEKAKMEKARAANLAKKYETSNILTSLFDVVDGSDKK